MTMCTVKNIKDAIKECCQSQHDMETAEIDRIFQSLPFSLEREPLAPPHVRRTRPFYRTRRYRT
ncbi:MAG: hypothetical protein Q4C65_14635 [Eubacteriales bacterium]|nr:hypothetical protein [Eubacteriales bacterium]